jgi:hypothetical protein
MGKFLSRLETHSKFMGRMMEYCGITMMQAARACMACGRTESCKKWLDVAERAGIQEPPSFCPNAERFRQSQEMY